MTSKELLQTQQFKDITACRESTAKIWIHSDEAMNEIANCYNLSAMLKVGADRAGQEGLSKFAEASAKRLSVQYNFMKEVRPKGGLQSAMLSNNAFGVELLSEQIAYKNLVNQTQTIALGIKVSPELAGAAGVYTNIAIVIALIMFWKLFRKNHLGKTKTDAVKEKKD